MNRNLFKIEKIEYPVTVLRHTVVRTAFAVIYKGVEINRFLLLEDAEACLEEGVAVRDDTEWAYDEALRRDGYDIPSQF